MDTFRSIEVVGMANVKMEDLQRSSKTRNLFAVTMLKKKIVAEFLSQFSRRDPAKNKFFSRSFECSIAEILKNEDICQIFYFE